MIGTVWEAAFWLLLAVFFGLVAATCFLGASRVVMYVIGLREQQTKWRERRARIERLRASRTDDWQAVMLRRVMCNDHLEEFRQEILRGAEETPLTLVEV